MKRVIKLTESDITRIVKRVIKEEKLSKQDVLKKHVLKNGWEEVAERIGGFDNLYKHAFNNDYNEFLNLFNNLEVVQSEERPNWMLYRFEKGNNIIIYNTKTGDAYINYEVIWSFFEGGIGFNSGKIRDIILKWLREIYNLDNVRVQNISRRFINNVLG